VNEKNQTAQPTIPGSKIEFNSMTLNIFSRLTLMKFKTLGITLGILLANFASASSDTSTIIPLQDNGAQTYYLEAQLIGLGKSKFMVDTGSGYTTINEQTLETLKQSGKAKYVKDLRGRLADGSEKRVAVYRISTLVLGESCEIHDIEAAIFPGSTRHILGMRTLRKAGAFEISFTPPQLVFRQCG
jgi:predicted aspartyl protease